MNKRLIFAVVAIATMISSGFTTLPAHAAYPPCTITVTTSGETVTGTSNGDVICLQADNLIVNALGGDDIVIDDGLNNTVYLGEGLDIYDGTVGEDGTVDGGSGNDTITGTPGEDELTGGEGDDTIIGGDANDILNGGLGDDELQGNAGDDNIVGEAGNDVLDGGEGADTAVGGDGADAAIGGDGNDTLNGDAGNDVLQGNIGDDSISGDAGNDSIEGGDGSDTLNGGDGADTLVGGSGNDTMNGGLDADQLAGGVGDDSISGDAGNDSIEGGDGSDTLNGGDGADTLVGGSGNDTMNGGMGADQLRGDAGSDEISGESGPDSLLGGEGNDVLSGGADIDTIDGGLGDNICDYSPNEIKNSSCVYDELAPVVQSLSFSTDTIETSQASQSQGFSLQLTDTTGIVSAALLCKMSAPNGYVYRALDVTWSAESGNLRNNISGQTISNYSISGNSRSLSLTGSVDVRLGQYPGTYGCSVEVQDIASNKTTRLTSSNFSVSRAGTGFDDLAPEVFDIEFSRNPVESGSAAQDITVSFSISDDTQAHWGGFTCEIWAGGANTRAIQLGWTDSRIFDYNLANNAQRRSSVSSIGPKTKRYSIDVQIPRGTPPGDYSCGFGSEDVLDNKKWQSNAAFFRVTRTGDGFDVKAPLVTVTSIQSVVDVGSESQELAVVINQTDSTGSNWSYFTCNGASNRFLSVGYSSMLVHDYTSTRTLKSYTVVGDSQNFTATIRFQVPFGATPGIYTCSSLVMDSLGYRADISNIFSFTVFRTPVGQPSSPTSVQFVSEQPTSGRLSWSEPSYLGSPAMRNYVAEVSENGTTWKPISGAATSELFIDFLNLKPGTQYWMRVRGDNGATGGQNTNLMNLNWGATTFTTPEATVPVAPSSLVVSNVKSKSFDLSWTANYNGGRVIENFTVESSTDNGVTWRNAKATASTSLSFSVSNALPGTKYWIRVAAVNSVGSSPFLEAVVTTFATDPTAPRSLVASNISSNGLTLSWLLPTSNGGAAITDYKVEFSSNNGTSWNEISHEASNNLAFDVTNLQKNRTYQFRVSAISEVGPGPVSNVVTITTLATVASAPRNLASSNLAANSATLSWAVPSDLGGLAITDYKVETSRDGTTWTAISRSASTNTNINLTGLAPGTNYLVRVSALNSQGFSETTQVEFTTLATVPTAPRTLTSGAVTSNSLTLSWLLPTSNGGAAITDYKVEFSSNNGTSWNEISHEASNNLAFDVTNLQKNRTYQFRVSAISEVGPGPVSNVVTITTLATVASAPRNLASSNLAANSATLSWAVPSDLGGLAITDYKVETSRDGTTWTAISRSASTNTNINLTGLAPGTNYLVRVSALNSQGFSETTQVEFTTLATVPTAPRTLTSGAVTSNSLTLSWLLPTSNGGAAITDYKVEFSSNAGVSWTEITHTASNNLAFDVTSLRSNQAYRFRVSAINEGGVGAASNIVSVTTLVGPAQEPTSLTASRATATGASLAWVAPTNTGGSRLTDYLVQLSRDGGNTWTTVTKRASTSLTLSLTGLAAATTYQVRVAAVNAGGVGATASTSFTTLAGPPSAPTNVRSSDVTGTTATIAWDLPPSNGGSAITNYRVEVSSNCSTYTVLPRTVSNSLAQNVTNLQPGVAYCFRVSTITAMGTSPVSTVLSVTTIGSAPNAPTSLAVRASATQVTLSWSAATVTGGGPVRNYLVEYSRDGGATWVNVTKPVSTSLTLAVRGLTRSTAYLFRVYAVNDSGTSTASTNLAVITPAR